jgi:hypothetical protein
MTNVGSADTGIDQTITCWPVRSVGVKRRRGAGTRGHPAPCPSPPPTERFAPSQKLLRRRRGPPPTRAVNSNADKRGISTSSRIRRAHAGRPSGEGEGPSCRKFDCRPRRQPNTVCRSVHPRFCCANTRELLARVARSRAAPCTQASGPADTGTGSAHNRASFTVAPRGQKVYTGTRLRAAEQSKACEGM